MISMKSGAARKYIPMQDDCPGQDAGIRRAVVHRKGGSTGIAGKF